MRKIFAILISLAVVFSAGCEKKSEEKEKVKLPEQYSYENKENSELIPNGENEEHGNVVEASIDDELPSEEELGEYEEILMEGDILSETSCAGWVLAISIKDITVNTYNKITKYRLIGEGVNCVDHIKPGDAVLLDYVENDDGTFSAYSVGRVRVEDDPLSKEDIVGASNIGNSED